jgi:hypothetical protein
LLVMDLKGAVFVFCCSHHDAANATTTPGNDPNVRHSEVLQGNFQTSRKKETPCASIE